MNENNEELIFKGMRQLRYKRQDDMLKDAIRSPYYWWWAFCDSARTIGGFANEEALLAT